MINDSQLKKVLIERDGYSPEEADEEISHAKEELFELIEAGDTETAYNFCEDVFGLEPDYLEDLMF